MNDAKDAKDAIQKYLDKEYGEHLTRLLTDPTYYYGEWIALVAVRDGPFLISWWIDTSQI